MLMLILTIVFGILIVALLTIVAIGIKFNGHTSQSPQLTETLLYEVDEYINSMNEHDFALCRTLFYTYGLTSAFLNAVDSHYACFWTKESTREVLRFYNISTLDADTNEIIRQKFRKRLIEVFRSIQPV